MVPLPPGDLVIGRARLVGTAGRGALEAGLARVAAGDLAGSGEVLLVSRLRAHTPLSPQRSPGDFGARLTDQLRALRAGAAVDPRGPVPGAVALRFTSKARYAAWLAALWLDGAQQDAAGAPSAAPKPAEVRAWLAREVLRDGRALVATAAHLQRDARLAAWVARLTPPERALAARALEQAYAVPPDGRAPVYPLSLLWPPQRLSRPSRTSPPATDRADPWPDPRPNGPAPAATARVLAAAWAELAAAEPGVQALDVPGQRLALSLAVLARQPNLGRHLSPALLERVLVAAPVAEPPGTAPQRQARRGQPSLDLRPVSGWSIHTPLGSGGSEADAAGADARPLPTKRPAPSVPLTEKSPIPGSVSHPALAGPTAAGTGPAAPLPPEAAAASFGTAFGGVLFLLNPLLALGLYPDFTRPRDNGLEPSPLWLVDRLALRLFGRDYRRDPLHGWLADCGLAGSLPPAWEADPQWFAGLAPGRHGFRPSRARTVLWDTRGFALVDAPGATARKRRSWLDRYRYCGDPAVRLPRQSRRRVPDDPDRRWVACLAEFLAVRLVLAGVAAGPAALRLPGRITADEERVEAAFDLAALPIELRLAGLDRDPGWLPAEGRSVAFRFD